MCRNGELFFLPTVNLLKMMHGVHCFEVQANISVSQCSATPGLSQWTALCKLTASKGAHLLFNKVLLRSSSSCLACMGTVRFLWASLVLIQEKNEAALLIMHYSWWIETHRALCQIFCGKAASSLVCNEPFYFLPQNETSEEHHWQRKLTKRRYPEWKLLPS